MASGSNKANNNNNVYQTKEKKTLEIKTRHGLYRAKIWLQCTNWCRLT